MKILFILPKIGSPVKGVVGIAFLSAVLKKAGYQVELLEVEDKKDIDKINLFIESYQPGLIGLSVNSHQYIYAVQIARKIKSKFDMPVFLGGIHVTVRPNEVIQEKSFDGICIGEAESALLELVRKIEKGQDYIDTDNFWFKRSGRIIKNDIGPLIEDLDSLAFPDYLIFKYFKEAGNRDIVPRFIFSRGCPFNCTYCSNHILKKIYAGRGSYLRFRSVDKALEEIALIRSQVNFKHFKIDDDTFSLNKPWVLEFCEKYPKRFDMTFECNVRCGAVDRETLLAFKKAGCNLIKVGIESGNEVLRKEVLGRDIPNQKIIELFDLAKEIGLLTYSFNMIGIPGETRETIKEAIDLNAKIRPDFFQVSIFYPYPGTILGEKCAREGLITKKHVDSCMDGPVLKSPNLTPQEIKKSFKNFKYNVYKHYNLKKALGEKKRHFKEFIASNSFLSRLIRPIYRLVKN